MPRCPLCKQRPIDGRALDALETCGRVVCHWKVEDYRAELFANSEPFGSVAARDSRADEQP
jgi:hypothetical protein